MLRAAKEWARARVEAFVGIRSPDILKYLAYEPDAAAFMIPSTPTVPHDAPRHRGLPVPPRALFAGYAQTPEDYTALGEVHVSTMLDLLAQSGMTLQRGDRVLDHGCAAGRMIRCLNELANDCEIWGIDISAPSIYWCKQYLTPPFHFATTTTIPHLPFEDRYFTLVCHGSVFTHIDDLADAWLLELRRVLAPGGRIYLTIHDRTRSPCSTGSTPISHWARKCETAACINRPTSIGSAC